MPKKKTALTIEERLQQALVPAEEQPYEVPENWVWVRLGAVCYASKEKSNDFSNDIKYIGLEHLEKDKGIVGFSSADKVKSTKNAFKEGQILYGRLRPYLNKHDITSFDGVCSTDILVFEATNLVANVLVDKFFNLPFFIEYVVSNSKGINLPRVSEETVLNTTFPLPPLSEQQRIVERIEELFAKLDEAKERLQEVADSFAVRKAAILHKAFTGELTKQWRWENGVSDESWEEITWGSFIEKIEAGKNWNALGRPPKNGEFGVVKVSAVTWGEFLEDESKTCTEESQWNEEKRISVGDFLFSRANTIQLVGNCVIVKDVKRKLMLSDKILRFSFSERVYDFFALWYTRTSSYRKQIESVASGNQDGMRNISQNKMKTIIFPLPTLSEQHEIVRLIDDLLARERAGAFKAGAGGRLKLNNNQDLGSGKS
ncbi:restriction endonuclease subunit S [Phascolarctobacterium succinatutens]|uniref:restriction endonuclease subunit S n=1 Tax=Phascolarctobacterium succinatutens TaxID=626940 RepID=UPI004028744F